MGRKTITIHKHVRPRPERRWYYLADGSAAFRVPGKCGTSSIRDFIYEDHHGHPMECHWDQGKSRASDSGWRIFEREMKECLSARDPEEGVLRVAVHRDPVERLESVYNGRVQNREDFQKTWMSRAVYSPFGREHYGTLTSYLGHRDEYDVVVPLGMLESVPEILQDHLKREFPAMRHQNSRERRGHLPAGMESDALSFYSIDIQMYWNGVFFRS